MKKVVIAILVLVALAVGGGLYWKWQQPQTVVSNPVDAIPISAALVLSYPHLTKTVDQFENQDYYQSLAGIKQLDAFFARNLLLDSLMRYNQELKTALAHTVLWSSYHTFPNDSIHFFHALKPANGTIQQVVGAFEKALRNKSALTQHNLEGQTVYKAVLSNPFDIVFFTVKNELLLAASDMRLLHASISQLATNQSLQQDHGFKKALNAAGKNVEANVFIRWSKMPLYLQGLLKDSTWVTHTLTNLAAWTELDLNMKPQGITLNGFTYTTDSVPQFLQVFLNQRPQTIAFPEVLPASTSSFLFFGIEDGISFSSNYRELLAETNRLAAFEAGLDSINRVYGIDLEQNFLSWIGHAFGTTITDPQQMPLTHNRYLVMETKSEQLAVKLLDELAAKLAEKTNRIPETVPVNGILVKELPLNGMLEALLGPFFTPYENPSYAVLKNHVIVGTNTQAVVRYVQFAQADRTLAKELWFSRFAENLSSTYNVFSYQHLKRMEALAPTYFNRKTVSALKDNPQLAQNFEAVGTQITSAGTSFYTNTFIKYEPTWHKEEETMWEAQTDAAPLTTPTFVLNHLSNQPEVLVQDKNHALYLFNKVGKRLFKAEIAEPIESEIVQVDAFRNGKLQYVFNTKNYIYLIDRNGQLVPGFPIKLAAPARTHLAVFDYDNNHDYRLIISCTNNRIYNYNIRGKKVQGWRHNRAPDPTIHSFKHLLVAGKDYLITGESNGKVHLLDRAGKNRVKVEQRIAPSQNNEIQVFKASNKQFTGAYITDKQGRIYHIALNGAVQTIDVGKFSPEHRFLVEDLDNDGLPEFIFSDLNMLQVFDTKKQKLIEQRIAPSATTPRLYPITENQTGIGFCYQDAEQLVLFATDGSTAAGFPLSGSSIFDLYQDQHETLVVSTGSENTLWIQAIR